MAKELKLNKPLIEKMIARMTEKPEAYEQSTVIKTGRWISVAIERGAILPRPDPECGAAGCLIAQAIICNAPSVDVGIQEVEDMDEPSYHAARLLGLGHRAANILFYGWEDSWPQPFRGQFARARTYKGQARAAVNLLRAILRTDGEILE